LNRPTQHPLEWAPESYMNERNLVLPVSSLSQRRIGAIVTVQVKAMEYRARIVSIANGKATVRLFERLSRSSESNLAVTLVQALPKKERMELIIQKATELGVAAILPCRSARSITLSEREAHQSKAHRWTAVAAKAAEQSRRRSIPYIGDCIDLAAALASASEAELKFILYEKEVEINLHDLAYKEIDTDLHSSKRPRLRPGTPGGSEEPHPLAGTRAYLRVRRDTRKRVPGRNVSTGGGYPEGIRLKANRYKSLAIAAGPEGGFTEDEVLLARSHGFLPVRLGGRILRCETASIAAISIAQFVWGDL
jgi:16S rRNA U1498 N3-methylase RsmE